MHDELVSVEDKDAFIADLLKDKYGITSLNDVTTRPNTFNQNISDYKVLVDILRLFLEIDEKDKFQRWIGKSNLRRRDAEVLSVIYTMVHQHEYDLYYIEVDKYCLQNNISLTTYEHSLYERDTTILRADKRIEDYISRFMYDNLYYFAVALMPAFTSIDRKSRLEFIDGLTARDKIIEAKQDYSLFNRFKKNKPPGV